MRNRKIVFLTREGCGLCEEARPHVARAARQLGVELVVIDLEEDPDLEAQYHLRIPVVLSPSGRILAEGSISRWQAFRAALLSFR